MRLQNEPLVIYDGICNLCDRSVKFILNHERKEELFFTHLESAIGAEIKKQFAIEKDFDGILFLEKGRLYTKSEAVLRISLYLKPPYSFLPFFFWLPHFIRNGIYDLIARNRYRYFGKDECIIPDERIKKRFI